MYRTGYELPDSEIRERYSRLGSAIDLPTRFYRNVASVVTRAAPRGARLLDAGCGNGRLLEQIALARSDLELYGFDVASASVHASLRRGDGQWRVLQASGLQLPFASHSFDVVTLVEVLEHLKDPVGGLHEAARLVRPGGRILLTVPNLSAWDPFRRPAERVPVDVLKRVFLPSEHPLRTLQPIDTAYTYDELLRLVDQAGLRVNGQFGHAHFPYVLAALQVVGAGAGATRSNAHAPATAESGLIRLHSWIDGRLADLVPPSLAYRLTLDCSAA